MEPVRRAVLLSHQVESRRPPCPLRSGRDGRSARTDRRDHQALPRRLRRSAGAVPPGRERNRASRPSGLEPTGGALRRAGAKADDAPVRERRSSPDRGAVRRPPVRVRLPRLCGPVRAGDDAQAHEPVRGRAPPGGGLPADPERRGHRAGALPLRRPRSCARAHRRGRPAPKRARRRRTSSAGRPTSRRLTC